MRCYLKIFFLIFLVVPLDSFCYPNERDLNTLRWFYPADEWSDKTIFLKGKFFEIKLKDDSIESALSIYLDKELKGKPAFRVNQQGIQGESDSCDYKQTATKEEISPYVRCSYASCELSSGKAFKSDISNDVGFKLIYSKSNLDNCPYGINYVHRSQAADQGDDDFLMFRYLDIGPNSDYVILESPIGNLYLDIRFCKTDKSSCKSVDIIKSKFEKDWDRLQVEIKNKSNTALNDLITNLLPCVKNKDKDCVSRYFVNENEPEIKKLFSSLDKKLESVTLNDELFSELTECLKYSNLLPHGLGSRGKNKVCLFYSSRLSSPPRGNTKLYPLVYPEGVRREPLDYNLIFQP